MVKVGILSMQRIANYGSFLQAYGLKKILEELNCEVQFVDYHPGNVLVPGDNVNGIRRKISKFVEVLKLNVSLKEKLQFIRYKKNYANNYLSYLGIEKTLNYNPEIDILVIGSDEVFNCVQNNSNVGFTPELFGQNFQVQRIITYAASFGNTTYEKLKQYQIDGVIGEWLKVFQSISVRDTNSEKIITKLLGKVPQYHLDPVLIYNFISKCEKIPNEVSENDYMILYGYSGRFSIEECIEIRKFANKNNLRVLCIGGIQNCSDKFIDCNPFHVIAYFQHAKYIITDTFHGTILSIITHKQFISIVRKSGYGNVEKITDLLSKFNLSNRIIDNLADCSDRLQLQIDYKRIDELINQERIRSYTYLKEQIKGEYD